MRIAANQPLNAEMLTSIEDLLDVVLDENGLCDRYADAAPGDVIIYHVGLLARDRDRLASDLPPDHRADLDATARRAWAMAAAGLGHLMQRRVGEGRCAYLLIVRARPRSARSTAGCALADLLHREVA